MLIDREGVTEPNEFADGNVVLNKTIIFDVFIFEGDKGSVVLSNFTVVS